MAIELKTQAHSIALFRRKVWLRHDLETVQKQPKALATKSAQTGGRR